MEDFLGTKPASSNSFGVEEPIVITVSPNAAVGGADDPLHPAATTRVSTTIMPNQNLFITYLQDNILSRC
ncbi:hypothetical protein D3C73_1197420 [compost metagenome]